MSLPIPSTSRNAPIDPRQLQAMDAPLVALTQQCRGDLRLLMHAFFSFLNRRTDFYLVHHPDDKGKPHNKMGFAEGEAEKMLVAAFRQFPLRRIPKGGVVSPAKGAAKKVAAAAAAAPPSAKATTPKTKDAPSSGKSGGGGGEKPKDEKKSLASKGGNTCDTGSPSPGTDANSKSTDNNENEDNERNIPSNMRGVRYNEEGLQIPVGNGGSTPRYQWTQTIDETTVLIGVPKSFRGKDYSVSITASKLSVKAKQCLPGEDKPRTFVEGELVDNVRVDESTWSVEGGVLTVTLEKARKHFWTAVCVGDVEKYKIDTELVDSRRRIDEYDDATQAKFRKIIFDQNQYHLDGPTADEILGIEKEKKNTSTIPGLPPGVEYKHDGSNPKEKPELPPGVEFIDKQTLDDDTKGKKWKK